MLSAPWKHVIQGDPRLLVVRNQIDILIPDPFFGHNLCCKYLNGLYELILNIYISRAFQWYKELFNTMSFDPSNHSLTIQKTLETPIPKMGSPLGNVWSHSLTFFRTPRSVDVIPRLHSWSSPFHALALVTNPRLNLWQKPTNLKQ